MFTFDRLVKRVYDAFVKRKYYVFSFPVTALINVGFFLRNVILIMKMGSQATVRLDLDVVLNILVPFFLLWWWFMSDILARARLRYHRV